MKLQIDSEEIYELLPWQEAVIKNDILEEEFVDHMKRIGRWVWEHKFEQCFKRFRQEWEPRLITEGAQTLPTSQEAFANLVFSHPDYKNRSAREGESQ